MRYGFVGRGHLGRAADAGIATLACPVTGGVHRAAAGDITVFVGGAQQLFERHAPALEATGDRGCPAFAHRISACRNLNSACGDACLQQNFAFTATLR
jgi:3-hydroxyisobutyrate dehydrogenase-like beta-hydroxyacid dehydrogenase